MDIVKEIDEIRGLKVKSDILLIKLKGGVGSGQKGHRTAKKDYAENRSKSKEQSSNKKKQKPSKEQKAIAIHEKFSSEELEASADQLERNLPDDHDDNDPEYQAYSLMYDVAESNKDNVNETIDEFMKGKSRDELSDIVGTLEEMGDYENGEPMSYVADVIRSKYNVN